MRRKDMSIPYPEDVLQKLHNEQLQILQDLDAICKKHDISYFALYGTALGAVRHGGFIPWDDDMDIGMLRSDYDRFLQIRDEFEDKYLVSTPLLTDGYSCTVTHFQRKGTRFIQRVSKDKEYFQGINIDIFPFDQVAPTKKLRRRQQLLTTIWGRLLFLRGCKTPVIETNILLQKPYEIACRLIHDVLCLLQVDSKTLFQLFQKEATRYNQGSFPYVTSFEYAGSIKDSIKASDLLPLTSVNYENIEIPLPANNDDFLRKVYGDYFKIPDKENQINHCPYLIEFSDGEIHKFL